MCICLINTKTGKVFFIFFEDRNRRNGYKKKAAKRANVSRQTLSIYASGEQNYCNGTMLAVK